MLVRKISNNVKRILFLCCMFYTAHVFGQRSDYAFKPVAFSSVQLTDHFWLPRIKVNHFVTIPASFERCESTGRLKNFVMAANRSGFTCVAFFYD